MKLKSTIQAAAVVCIMALPSVGFAADAAPAATPHHHHHHHHNKAMHKHCKAHGKHHKNCKSAAAPSTGGGNASGAHGDYSNLNK